MLLKIFYFFYNVKNKEKEDQNVLENKKNKYLRREIRHSIFVFYTFLHFKRRFLDNDNYIFIYI